MELWVGVVLVREKVVQLTDPERWTTSPPHFAEAPNFLLKVGPEMADFGAPTGPSPRKPWPKKALDVRGRGPARFAPRVSAVE